MTFDLRSHSHTVTSNVTAALLEDVGEGDITAQLIDANERGHARVISREQAVIAGRPWVDEVFRQLDDRVDITWHIDDGQQVSAEQTLFELHGHTRSLLTGERCALNFLQTLSATATRSHHYAQLVADTPVTLLDTRKTLPGLRVAQKYAVNVGGCSNHRMGLYDAFLIKENHIVGCGGIAQAIAQAKINAPGKPVEVEVETMAELEQALTASADIVMLDNFSPQRMREAVALNKTLTAGTTKLEASGNITDSTLRDYAQTGVDYISIGALTKDCRAIDLSMRLHA